MPDLQKAKKKKKPFFKVMHLTHIWFLVLTIHMPKGSCLLCICPLFSLSSHIFYILPTLISFSLLFAYFKDVRKKETKQNKKTFKKCMFFIILKCQIHFKLQKLHKSQVFSLTKCKEQNTEHWRLHSSQLIHSPKIISNPTPIKINIACFWTFCLTYFA